MGNEYAVERTMGRTESGKCQSKTHKTYRDTLTLWIVAFIMIAGLSIALGSNLVSAHDKSEQPEQKFYKSIEIKEGTCFSDFKVQLHRTDCRGGIFLYGIGANHSAGGNQTGYYEKRTSDSYGLQS